MAKILVVEDEEDVRDVIVRYLKTDSHEVLPAASIEDMYNVLEKECVDVLILDLMLPDGDAMDEIPTIRVLCPSTFIIVVTALREDKNKILGLEMGADDYVTKPFHPRELVARVRAILRRKNSLYTKELVYKDMKLSVDERVLYIGEKMVELSSKEFEILFLMFKNPRKIFSRMELLENVWRDEERNERIVDVYISMLRKKLGKERLVTVHGVGYKLG
ncbi:response regulator transcription factor [Pseudothermotoga thermarum]|uniref:Two component transcriptional regulator, winged helix family n=1 Tax=Pseudothermotoga thermarum DSM 5069 TaxID=688269 RepID=F7YXJ0_9THEM|nr:response regulator transcription factor [Pseudothermotoga thermarum]AEH50631.1 two component transcriptional regulator, winged helix family [Pseudothermotoga thermarum DSM 5069]